LEILKVGGVPRWKIFFGDFDSDTDRFFEKVDQKGIE